MNESNSSKHDGLANLRFAAVDLSRRRTLQLAGSGFLAAALAACGSSNSSGSTSAASAAGQVGTDWDQVIQDAKREGALTLYSSRPQAEAQKTGSAFKSQYGINVSVVQLEGGPLEARIAAEQQAHKVQVDVVQISDPPFLEQAGEKNWIVHFGADDLPAVKSWPKTNWNGSYAREGISPIVINYNTQHITAEEAPTTWKDALNPKWAGKILVPDPRPAEAVWLLWLSLMQTTYGDSFLADLKKLRPQTVSSAVPGAQQLAAGQGWLMFPSLQNVTEALIAKGAPLASTHPEFTTGAEILMAVAADAPHPNAARLFLNWIMTKDGQEAANSGVAASPLSGVPGTLTLPSQYVPATPERINAGIKAESQLLALSGVS